MTSERRARYLQRIAYITETLNFYYEAEKAILGGAQQYSVGSRSLTRATLSTVSQRIIEYENLLDRLKSEVAGEGRNLQVGVVPLDI